MARRQIIKRASYDRVIRHLNLMTVFEDKDRLRLIRGGLVGALGGLR